MEPQTPPQQPTTPQPAPMPAAPAPTPPPQQPAEPQPAPMPAAPAPVSTDPGKGLGIASLILGIFGLGLIGLILGIIGHNKSKKAGMKNGVAVAGIIVSIISIIIGLVVGSLIVFGAMSLVQKCQELGPGVHEVNGTTYTCN